MLRRRGVVSPKDADAIALMRQAGAIPLAVTNVSELCMWYESSNLVYGCTRNAYHQGRMVGGSSGKPW
jgi:fatty acid amide hydrolase 2